mgnify:CR=1 FL=1
MKYYLDYFNTGGCAFIKKPANLCMTETAITCPTPPPKEQSFKGKKYNLKGYIEALILDPRSAIYYQPEGNVLGDDLQQQVILDIINKAQKLDEILQTVHNAMFVESNPSPVKYAAKLMNLCDDAVRLPLVKVTEDTKSIIKQALVSAKLI